MADERDLSKCFCAGCSVPGSDNAVTEDDVVYGDGRAWHKACWQAFLNRARAKHWAIKRQNALPAASQLPP